MRTALSLFESTNVPLLQSLDARLTAASDHCPRVSMLSSSRAASCGLKTIPRVALRRSFSIGTFSTRNKFPSVKLDFERYLQDLDLTKRHVQERNAAVSEQDVDRLASLYAERKALVKTLDGLRHEQKLASSNMDRDRAIQLRQQAKETSTSLSAVESQLQDCASLLPNWTHPDAPTGGYEACEQVYASDFSTTTSESDPDLESQPPAVKPEDQDHLTVATRLGWVDFHSGQKIAGSRWPVLLKEGAILEWALTQYALHTAMQHGFQPISAPDVVRTALSDRCGFQPRDGQASQSFYVNTQEITTERSELVLAGTAEIPLAGHLSKQVHASDDMPIQLVALGRSFRAEAGARGKEHRGLYRVHQFSKAELFVACHPNDSDEWLDKLVNMQIRLLENLKLPLRCVGDLVHSTIRDPLR